MSIIRRGRAPDYVENRYDYDFGICQYKHGWCQIDTHQDASYFGIWTNPEYRVIHGYAEGDVTVEWCDDDAEYQSSLLRCLLFYRGNDGGPTAKIDCKTYHPSHPMRETFVRLGLAAYLH